MALNKTLWEQIVDLVTSGQDVSDQLDTAFGNIDDAIDQIDANTDDIADIDGRVNTLEGFRSYDNASADAITVTNDVYEDIINLTTPARDAGVYKLEQSLIYSLDSTNTSAFFRSSIDGGVTWLEIRKEPQDNTDKIPVAYFRSFEHTGGTMNFIIQARKEATGDVLEVYRADLSVERKA